MFRRAVVSFALVPLLLTAGPVYAQSAPDCQFVLGFATLHSLDPSDIGDCVDNQASAANGDAQQHTTNGLMAWRKSDNWTAFTNGYMTWINGPNGLASRLNTQRYSWEANPDGLPVVAPPPTPAPPPAASQDGPPVGTYQANDGSVAVAAWDFRYFTRSGILQAGPGARYIAFAVEVQGRNDISVNPLYFTLVLSDGSAYSVDDGMFSYWSSPLQATDVPAGGHAEGGILFLVRAGATPAKLIYKPIQLFNFTKVVVDLTQASQ